MKALLGVMVAAVMACTPRPWNFDETDRIGEVMGTGLENPLTEATVRSVSAPELPDVLPYPQPVYVAPIERHRSAAIKGKRTTPAERARGLPGGKRSAGPRVGRPTSAR